MADLRFACIGVAGIAGAHLDSIPKRPGVEVVGLCDVSDVALANAQAKFPSATTFKDPAELLATVKPDVVAVCTPNKWHAEYSILALEAGAHVICEKPMAMTSDEAIAMEAARAKAGKIGMVNFSYRNNMAFRFARQLIANGDLGDLQRVQAVYLQSWLGAEGTKYSWRNDASVAGFGALGDLGVHMIDGVRFITGRDYESVVGLSEIRTPQKPDAHGVLQNVTTDTNACWLAKMSGGVVGTFETSQTAAGYGNYFRIEVSGSKGTLIVVSDKDGELQLFAGPTLSHYATWTTGHPTVSVPSGFRDSQKAYGPGLVIAAIRGETEDYPTFADGVAAQSVLTGIAESMASGAWAGV
ncbi:MAG: Gfo/Idh/MocA family protein [Fimbriimonas sp.]